jgi:hypothetical protein
LVAEVEEPLLEELPTIEEAEPPPPVIEWKPPKPNLNRTPLLFDKVRKEFSAAAGRPIRSDQAITVQSYTELSSLERIIDANDEHFHLSEAQISQATAGDFELKTASSEWVRLFASKITEDILHNATRKFPRVEQTSQTLFAQIDYQASAVANARTWSGNTFLSLIPTDFSQRDPQPLSWLIPFMAVLYTEQTIENQSAFAENRPLTPFPHVVVAHAKRSFAIEFLRDQFCWDLHITAHALRSQSTQVEMFCDFLDERYDASQLAFFLICRGDCLTTGSSVAVRTNDQVDMYEECFLSLEQLERILPKWWAHRYKRKYFVGLLDLSGPRPAIHLSATTRYVAMGNILFSMMCEYTADLIERLSEALDKYRISPRPTLSAFSKLAQKIIPGIPIPTIERLHRANLTKGGMRREVTIDKFMSLFSANSILNAQLAPTSESDDSKKHGVLPSISAEWAKQKLTHENMIDFFKTQCAREPDNVTLKTQFNEVIRFQSLLAHAVSVGDEGNAARHFYQLLFGLDLLMSIGTRLRPQDHEPGLKLMEVDVRENWLDRLYPARAPDGPVED